MSRKEAKVTAFPTSDLGTAAVQVGHIVAVNENGWLIVEVARLRRIARLAMALDAEQLQRAIEQQQPAVLVFENGDETKPIVMGLIAAPLTGAELSLTPAATNSPASDPHIEADVDGRRVRLTAKDEIVLECGLASITMRRNGRVVIRGTHVESYSDGTNRIKGGQVRIN